MARITADTKKRKKLWSVEAINKQKLILTNPKKDSHQHGAYGFPPPIIIQKSEKHFWWIRQRTVLPTTCG